MPALGWTLRRKLIAACVGVQLAASALLVAGGAQLLRQTLVEQTAFETRQVLALLDQAIAAPLAQRDYATLQQTLDQLRDANAISYLVLWDHRDKLAASSGWDATQPLPPRDHGDVDLQRPDDTLHLSVPVALAGQVLGRVDLGLSTTRLRQAKADFLQRGLAVGALALALSSLALAAIAYAITRHLAVLERASQRVAEGDFDIQVPTSQNDEIGRLGAGFNAMAQALKQRVAALEDSQRQQRLTLAVAEDERSRLTALLGAMHSGILFVDARSRIVYANAAFARIWSLPELAAGRPLADILPLMLHQTEPEDAAFVEALWRAADGEQSGGLELRTTDGRVIAQRMQPVAQGDEDGGRVWIHEDVTLERQTQQRAHQALHDPLTALFNRRGLYESLRQVISQAATQQPSPVALLFIDLDDFKYANDVGGHRMGDEILMSVARVLAGQMRKGELVARFGGDEFAILCPGVGPDEAAAIAARLVEAVSALRFATPEQTLRVGCSVGIATYPADALGEDDLMACADAAMYQAKQSGKNGWAAYRDDPLQSQAESARANWNARIHRALQDQRFVLYFQPVHRLADLRLSHHEALLRMVDESDPERLISPADFVPHAERSGQIRQIDRWVFDACVARLATEDPAVCIAANLSARSLEDASFPAFLRDTLQRLDVDPRRLHIELTETSAISDAMAARQLIDALRNLGCAVHLDDFGSGFSSFAHLKLLDVDAIKIDGSFIRNLQSDSSSRLFVASMIDIAHNLNKTVVAEHVEDAATLDILRGLGVDLVQGFHLGRPAGRLKDAGNKHHLQVVADFRRTGHGDLV